MSIYEQHDKAFSRVSAFVVVHDGQKVATVAFKAPADGAGRLYAYVHWLGEPMVRGFAGGFGYDKRSAACADAARKLAAPAQLSPQSMGRSRRRAPRRGGCGSRSAAHWPRTMAPTGISVSRPRALPFGKLSEITGDEAALARVAPARNHGEQNQ